MHRKRPYNFDRLTSEGLIDFVNFAQKNPSEARKIVQGLDKEGVHYKTLQTMINYCSFKAFELLDTITPEEKKAAHDRAEQEYVLFPMKYRWRPSDEDAEYAYLRNLDAMSQEELVSIGHGTISPTEFWKKLFPHVKVGIVGERETMTNIRKMARFLEKHRKGKGLDVSPNYGEQVDIIHLNIPPWAQWRQHFGGYSSVQDKNLPIEELTIYHYTPHVEPFTGKPFGLIS